VTRARAPGKVVLSGAYSVLSGAPAIVTAVSRYVRADTARTAQLVTDEVQAALAPNEAPPWFDASALRRDGRKLGLGSSAAILVASLFALELRAAPGSALSALRARVFERSLRAHRIAQGGGSGVDVAASSFGGTLVYRLEGATSRLAAVTLPEDLSFEVWTCPTSASTRDLLAAVAELAKRAPERHAHWLGAQSAAANAAASSIQRAGAPGFVAALVAQQRALSGLGIAAGVPIVTPELTELGPLAEQEGGVLLPAGAGGGDIALFVGVAPSSPELRRALDTRTHRLLETDLSAPGVEAEPGGDEAGLM
jgi:phosphomevalonate kinase